MDIGAYAQIEDHFDCTCVDICTKINAIYREESIPVGRE